VRDARAQSRGLLPVGRYRLTMLTGTPVDNASTNRLIRMPAVIAFSGNARSTVYRRIAEGLWPEPVKIGPRTVGWPAAEVAALNAARIAGLSDDEIRALVAKLMVARRAMKAVL
jgi:prophage regulatory protein